ncbi:hypothetical protein [Bacillus phage PM1]|uniref:Uncharacterized protein n=1 Tax=Bacillus phage PM1 TaxID=547228 RepID=M4ZRP7_9CAUD|nr:hypothetical protein K203_gp86 [Bacillus phage PM1]BAM99166.1 hypothetical protein [Bacillus phage PM1]
MRNNGDNWINTKARELFMTIVQHFSELPRAKKKNDPMMITEQTGNDTAVNN